MIANWLNSVYEYRQEQPFKIYVVGPNASTNVLFFSGVRTHIHQPGNHSGDRLEGDADYPVANVLPVFRQRREGKEPALRYRLIHDESVVAGTTAPDPATIVDNIDAFVLTFRIGSREDFSTLYHETVDRVVRICEHQLRGGPKKIIFLVAHKAQMFNKDTGFADHEMGSLMRRGNTAFRIANLNSHSDCGDIMNFVIEDVVRQHADHGRRQAAAREHAASLQPRSGWLQILHDLQRTFLPVCVGPSRDSHSEATGDGGGAPPRFIGGIPTAHK